jgi:hypothetical protein
MQSNFQKWDNRPHVGKKMEDEDSPKNHPTVVRLRPELRAELLRCALENKRSLSKEIGIRLRNSFAPPPSAQQPTTTYQAHTSQGPLIAEDRTPGAAPLNDHDRALLTVFRQLSPEKQLSLLTLLKP